MDSRDHSIFRPPAQEQFFHRLQSRDYDPENSFYLRLRTPFLSILGGGLVEANGTIEPQPGDLIVVYGDSGFDVVSMDENTKCDHKILGVIVHVFTNQ